MIPIINELTIAIKVVFREKNSTPPEELSTGSGLPVAVVSLAIILVVEI